VKPSAASVADLVAGFVVKILGQPRANRPLIVALQGPQGSGKTTACNAAVQALQKENNLRGVTLSIDDFYLTRAEQIKLAAQHAGNVYLSQRGYPGTHNIPLGTQTLQQLRTINHTHEPVAVPRYDKSLCDGEGDRLPESSWPVIEAPLDFVLLEGWCVGFTPVPEADIQDAHLTELNRLLEKYRSWYELFDAFVQLQVENINRVIDWRIEAEDKMHAAGKSAMAPERIRAYIERFLPAYRLYLPHIADTFAALPRLTLQLGVDRNVISSDSN
jgi:D-glycerate 3-kinase